MGLGKWDEVADMPLVLILEQMAAVRRRDSELALRSLEVQHAAMAPLMVDKGKQVYEACQRRLRAVAFKEKSKTPEKQAFESMVALARLQQAKKNNAKLN